MHHYLSLLVCLVCLGGVSSLVPPSSSQKVSPLKNWPFANDGLVNPPSYYQRYRRDEYPAEKPFFQWWYYYLSDFTNNRYFFLSYGIMETIPNDTAANTFGMAVGEVDAETGLRWKKEEQFPVDILQITNYFDVQAINDGDLMYHLEVINNDTFRLFGVMNHTKNVAYCEGIPEDTVITWDVTLNRINGWYGQQDLEEWQRDFAGGEIAWNTYTHNSLVEGTVTIGDQVYNYNHSTQFRAYGDMNWGERFPAGPSLEDAVNYPWGWFTVNVPAENPIDDFAVVIGTGLSTYSILGNIWGGFADFRFNQTHLGIRQVLAWDGRFYSTKVVSTASDGELKLFTNNASNFITYSDNGYNFSVPLQQTVSLETTHYSIFMDFTTTIAKINRIEFADGNNTFSDFEALGSTVHVVMDYIDENGNRSNMYDFISQTAGIEYGYETAH